MLKLGSASLLPAELSDKPEGAEKMPEEGVCRELGCSASARSGRRHGEY